MRTLGFFFLLLVAQFFAIGFQHNFEPVPALRGACPLLYPLILAYGALALPFGLTLALAFFSGLWWDALTVEFLSADAATPAGPEFLFGWSILVFGLLCVLVHGLRPLFLRGRWDVVCLASALLTCAILLTEFLAITFRRGGLVFPVSLWPKIVLPGVINLFLAPVVYFALNSLASLLQYPVRIDEEEPRA